MKVPLPEHEPIHKFMKVYTADQLQTYGEACRREAQQNIADLISRSDLKGLLSDQNLFMYTAKLLMDIAENIRRLK